MNFSFLYSRLQEREDLFLPETFLSQLYYIKTNMTLMVNKTTSIQASGDKPIGAQCKCYESLESGKYNVSSPH